MKLRFSPTSPYVRKVTVLALETGLDDRIERVPANPWDAKDDLPNVNPLGKVPALTTEDGRVLFDSALICEYLDSLHDGAKLFPPDGPERWTALRQQALGNGILEAAVLTFIETGRRPEAARWPLWVERQTGKIERALDLLEREVEALGGQPTIGSITVAIALDYVDFRVPDLAWRDGRPKLAAWHAEFSQRPSMQATLPREA